jgi:hypothetical protein
MLIDTTKTADWPDGLVWKLIEKLCAKFNILTGSYVLAGKKSYFLVGTYVICT